MMNRFGNSHCSFVLGAILILFRIQERCTYGFQSRITPGGSHNRVHPTTTTFLNFPMPTIRKGIVHIMMAADDDAVTVVDTDVVVFDDMEAKTTEVIVSDATDTKSINVEMLQRESFLRDARHLIESTENGLTLGGVDVFPPELDALKHAVDDSSTTAPILSQRIYELLIEKAMRYDLDPATGRMTPTEFNIKENLDVPAVKNEFFRQYSFGMQAAMTGVLDIEKVKEIVVERLINRTGLTPEEFDKWLGF